MKKREKTSFFLSFLFFSLSILVPSPFPLHQQQKKQERQIVERERTSSGDGGYPVLPYFLAKLSAEAPLGAAFPLLFGAAVYPSAGLNPSPARFARFCGVLSLEALTSTAMGLAVGAAAPNADAAMAIGPAVTVIFIVFGGVCVFFIFFRFFSLFVSLFPRSSFFFTPFTPSRDNNNNKRTQIFKPKKLTATSPATASRAGSGGCPAPRSSSTPLKGW